MALDTATDVYFDAGVCTPGKSWAGSIAFVILDAAGTVLLEHAQGETAEQHGQPTVENNALETISAAKAMAWLPDGWAGTVHGDNLNALRRISDPDGTTFGGVPPPIERLVRENRARLGRFKTRLLSGHPSKAHIAAGVKKGKPVSVHNKRCDTLATAVRKELQAGRRGSP